MADKLDRPYPPACDLWAAAAALIRAVLGWELRPMRLLGRRDDRRVWLADGPAGPIIVKVLPSEFRQDRADWTKSALDALKRRGCPVPSILWQGSLDESWWVVVQTRLPGEPLQVIDASTVDQLIGLVELQAEFENEAGGWDVSWWLSVVLFDGWEGWWDDTEVVAPNTARRLRAFLEPAWNYRLAGGDIVHGNLNSHNVLARDGRVCGIVDWDNIGYGSRAIDLSSLLFDLHRLACTSVPSRAPDGGHRLVRRIVEVSGWNGLRCTITYGAIARLALSSRSGEVDKQALWRKAIDALLDSVT